MDVATIQTSPTHIISIEDGGDGEDGSDDVCSSELRIPKSAFEMEESSEDGSRVDATSLYRQIDSENGHKKWEYNDMYARSNSPIASNCNSDVEDRIELAPKRLYKKLTCEDIEDSLSKYYDKNVRIFKEIDLIITYLKGVRFLYTQSKTITEVKLYGLVMLSFCLTIALSILAPFTQNMSAGGYLLSSGNALVAVLIAITRYLKLEQHEFEYMFMARQYDKFKCLLEKREEDDYSDWTFDLNDTDPNKVVSLRDQTLQDIERKIKGLKENETVLIPAEIIRMLPLVYNTNIFRFIKKMEQYKKNLIIRLRDIKNEIHYIQYRQSVHDDDAAEEYVVHDKRRYQHASKKTKEDNRLIYLMNMKEKTKRDLLLCNNTYSQMDELFNREIRHAETHQSCLGCTGWFRPNYDFSKLNPVVQDYLKLAIPD